MMAEINKLMGRRVALHYVEKVGLPTSCFGETRYYVTRVTLVEEIQHAEKIPAGSIVVEIPDDLNVLFDPGQLNQILWNLIRNAWQHCQKKEGSIRIAARAGYMGDAVICELADDGPGIPAELRGQIFEPFFTTRPGGTGLGLYIARELADANGAALSGTATSDAAGFYSLPVPVIRDDAGNPLPPHEAGEVVIRGPGIRPYEDDPEANREAFRDGWFRTGDLGYFDEDGYLYLTGRVKELINRGGLKVSPHEVDAALMRHPDVAEAATFAVPHPTLGEDVAAAVVVRNPSVTAQQLRDYALEQLAHLLVGDGRPKANARLAKGFPTGALATLRLPDGWKSEPPHLPVTLAHAGDETSVRFIVTPPPASLSDLEGPERANGERPTAPTPAAGPTRDRGERTVHRGPDTACRRSAGHRRRAGRRRGRDPAG